MTDQTRGEIQQEKEATEFAIHLLIPDKYLTSKIKGRVFNLSLIDEICEECCVEQWVAIERAKQAFKTQKYLESKTL